MSTPEPGTTPAPSSRWSDLTRPPLTAALLRSALVAPAGPLSRLEVLAEVDSTNAELARRATGHPAGWPHLSVVTADVQSAGRGRLGRSWVAPPRAGLALSVLLRPTPGPQRWPWLPLLAGLVVSRVLRDVAGLPASVKWPNDVLVGERKVAGVLCEVLPGAGGAPPAGVVLGIGVNVSTTAAELPVPTATSLALEGAAVTDRDTLARAVLRTLAAEVERWSAADGDPVASGLAARVREACSTLGAGVRVELPGGSAMEGLAEGIDDDGRLLVRAGGESEPVRADGRSAPEAAAGSGAAGLTAVTAGDVVHLRLRSRP